MRQKQGVFSLFLLSPSSRRAWIEIAGCGSALCASGVALLAEGVDRNTPFLSIFYQEPRSPSSRRAWIEIHTTSKV